MFVNNYKKIYLLLVADVIEIVNIAEYFKVCGSIDFFGNATYTFKAACLPVLLTLKKRRDQN
jgi:hypothetical protein